MWLGWLWLVVVAWRAAGGSVVGGGGVRPLVLPRIRAATHVSTSSSAGWVAAPVFHVSNRTGRRGVCVRGGGDNR